MCAGNAIMAAVLFRQKAIWFVPKAKGKSFWLGYIMTMPVFAVSLILKTADGWNRQKFQVGNLN